MKRLVALSIGCLLVAWTAAGADSPKQEEVKKYVANLKDKDEKSRINACKGIGEIGQLKSSYAKDAVEPLTALVRKDGSARVRAEAANALGLIDPEQSGPVVEALMGALKDDKDDGVHRAAITALGRLGAKSKDALPLLREEQEKVKKMLDDVKDDKAKSKRFKEQMKVINGAIMAIGGGKK